MPTSWTQPRDDAEVRSRIVTDWINRVTDETATVEDALIVLMRYGIEFERVDFTDAVEARQTIRDLANGFLDPWVAPRDRNDQWAIDRVRDQAEDTLRRRVERMSRTTCCPGLTSTEADEAAYARMHADREPDWPIRDEIARDNAEWAS